MKLILRLFLLLLCVSAPLRETFGNKPAKPNLIVIFTDDRGWADLGANGVDPHILTPHLDLLAKDGVRFQRGYVTLALSEKGHLIHLRSRSGRAGDSGVAAPCLVSQ